MSIIKNHSTYAKELQYLRGLTPMETEVTIPNTDRNEFIHKADNIMFFENHYCSLTKSRLCVNSEVLKSMEGLSSYQEEQTQENLEKLGADMGKNPYEMQEADFVSLAKHLSRELDSEFARRTWALVVIFAFQSISNVEFVKSQGHFYNSAFSSFQILCESYFDKFIRHPSLMFILKALTRSLTTGLIEDSGSLECLRTCRTHLFFGSMKIIDHDIIEFASAISAATDLNEDIRHLMSLWFVNNVRYDRIVYWILNVIPLAKNETGSVRLCNVISYEILKQFLQTLKKKTIRLSQNELNNFCKELMSALKTPKWPSAIVFMTSFVKVFVTHAKIFENESYRIFVYRVMHSWAQFFITVDSNKTDSEDFSQSLSCLLKNGFSNGNNVFQQRFLHLKYSQTSQLLKEDGRCIHSRTINQGEWIRILSTTEITECNNYIKEMVVQAMESNLCETKTSNRFLVTLYRLLATYVDSNPKCFNVKWIQYSKSLRHSQPLYEFVKSVYEYVKYSRDFANLGPLLMRMRDTGTSEFKLYMVRIFGLAVSSGGLSELMGWQFLLITILDSSQTVSKFAQDQCYACLYQASQLRLQKIAEILEKTCNVPGVIQGVVVFVQNFKQDLEMKFSLTRLTDVLVKKECFGLASRIINCDGSLVTSASLEYLSKQPLSDDGIIHTMHMFSSHIQSERYHYESDIFQRYFIWAQKYLSSPNEKLAISTSQFIFQLATTNKELEQQHILTLSKILADSLNAINESESLEELQKHAIVLANVGAWRFDLSMATAIMDSLMNICETHTEAQRYIVASIIRICYYYPCLDFRCAPVIIANLKFIASRALWQFLRESVDILSPIQVDFDCLSSLEKKRCPLKTPKDMMIGICMQNIDTLTNSVDDSQDLDALRVIGAAMDERQADLNTYIPKLVSWCFHSNDEFGRISRNIFQRMCRLHPDAVLINYISGLEQVQWEMCNLSQFGNIWWCMKRMQPQKNIQLVIVQLCQKLFPPYLNANQTSILLKTLSKIKYKTNDARQFHIELKTLVKKSLASNGISASHFMFYMFDRWLFERYISRPSKNSNPISVVNFDLIAMRFPNSKIKPGLIKVLETTKYGSKKMMRLVYGA